MLSAGVLLHDHHVFKAEQPNNTQPHPIGVVWWQVEHRQAAEEVAVEFPWQRSESTTARVTAGPLGSMNLANLWNSS